MRPSLTADGCEPLGTLVLTHLGADSANYSGIVGFFVEARERERAGVCGRKGRAVEASRDASGSFALERRAQDDSKNRQRREFVGEKGGRLRRVGMHRDPSRSKGALRMTARTDNGGSLWEKRAGG